MPISGWRTAAPGAKTKCKGCRSTICTHSCHDDKKENEE